MGDNKFPFLNLPSYSFKIKRSGTDAETLLVFDPIRKKDVVLTPEEWVRQHFIQYLLQDKNTPKGLIAVEQGITYNKMQKRCDVIVYHSSGDPLLIVECKSPNTKINQDVFDQIARYNMALKVKYLAVTNGINHYYCFIDHEAMSYNFLEELPGYEVLVNN